MIDKPAKLELNVLAGKAARLALSFVEESLTEAFAAYDPRDIDYDELAKLFTERFYETLAELLGDRLPRKIEPYKPLTPMNSHEREAFEQRTIMFGKHSGKKIWQIAEQDIEWLDWYARQEDELRKSINRYLLCKDQA